MLSSLTQEQLFFVSVLVAWAIISGFALIRKGLEERRERLRLREALHRGDRLDVSGFVLPTRFPSHYRASDSPPFALRPPLKRGSALLESLAVIAFCAVIAAALVLCLSDLDLIAQP